MTTVTVVGANGQTVVVNFQYPEYAAFAASLLPADGSGNLMAHNAISAPDSNALLGVTTFGAGEALSLTPNTDGSAGIGGTLNLTDTAGAINQVILTGTGTNLDFTSSAGAGTIVAGGGVDTFNLGSGSWDLLTGQDGSTINSGSGFDTITLGGADTLTIGSGNDTVFGLGTGTSITVGTGSLLYVAGPDTTTSIAGGTGVTLAFGNTGADIVFSGTSTGNIFVAGAGNATLDGSGASGGNIFFSVGGDNSLVGGTGNDFMLAGDGGNATMTGGGGQDVFAFYGTAGAMGSTSADVVTDFSSSDYFELTGGVTATSSAATSGGLQYTLSDGTTVTFTGVTSIDPGHIITG